MHNEHTHTHTHTLHIVIEAITYSGLDISPALSVLFLGKASLVERNTQKERYLEVNKWMSVHRASKRLKPLNWYGRKNETAWTDNCRIKYAIAHKILLCIFSTRSTHCIHSTLNSSVRVCKIVCRERERDVLLLVKYLKYFFFASRYYLLP